MGSLYDETAAQFYVGSCAGIKSTAAGIASDFGARKRDFSCFVGIGEGTSATISSSKEHARSSTSAHGDVGEMKSIQEYGRHVCMGKRSGGQTWVPNACGHLCEGKLLVGRHCRRL